MTRPAKIPRTELYDPDCTRCPRLAEFLAETHHKYPQYWARPVPSFGSEAPRILIVGLAPGMHGANRTGRPFTGDHAGILLYETLFELGLATRPVSVSTTDRLELKNTRIANAVKCVPPENKPLPAEIRECNAYLERELAHLSTVRVVLALGRIAHESVIMALRLKRSAYPFGHGREHVLPDPSRESVLPDRSGESHALSDPSSESSGRPGRRLIDSYHCSRYNTQTGVLTAPMFRKVVARACKLAGLTG